MTSTVLPSFSACFTSSTEVVPEPEPEPVALAGPGQRHGHDRRQEQRDGGGLLPRASGHDGALGAIARGMDGTVGMKPSRQSLVGS